MTKTAAELAKLTHVLNLRWLARTDLEWLCRNILDYNQIAPHVHGSMLKHLQQFKLPSMAQMLEADQVLAKGGFRYTPVDDPYVALEGKRRRMTFFLRGGFKTSLCTVAHTVQWILNYPHLAYAMFFSTGDKSTDVLRATKRHFQNNRRMREIFPDYCPRGARDWGTLEEFIMPNRDEILFRKGMPPRVEPTVKSLSLDKSKAGYHFDVIKCSDLVDEKNVLTPGMRQSVEQDFGLMPKLLVKRFDGHPGWIDLEGTFYHPDDLHVQMVKEWRTNPDTRAEWQIYVRGVFVRDIAPIHCTKARIAPRSEHLFDPDEMMVPFLLDANGKRVATWPEAEPTEKLEIEEKSLFEGGHIFAGQKVLDYSADKSANRPFACGARWKTATEFRSIPIAWRMIATDFASTTGTKSNPSVIAVAALDTYGRTYVESIQRGKWGQDETVRRIFDTFAATPEARIVSIEKSEYMRGLRPSIERMAAIRQVSPPFHWMDRERAADAKLRRIIRALSAPINGSDLYFIDPLNEDPGEAALIRVALEAELSETTAFSLGKTDDILDTVADFFLVRETFGREVMRNGLMQDPSIIARARMLQFTDAFSKMCYPDAEAPQSEFYRTGW